VAHTERHITVGERGRVVVDGLLAERRAEAAREDAE
jgi:ribonuclease VapC